MGFSNLWPRRIIVRILACVLPLLFAGLWLTTSQLQNAFQRIVSETAELTAVFQDDILDLERTVMQLAAERYALEARLQERESQVRAWQRAAALRQEAAAQYAAVVRGAVPAAQGLVAGMAALPQASVVQVEELLATVFSVLGGEVVFWRNGIGPAPGLSEDVIEMAAEVRKRGKADWLEDEAEGEDIVVSFLPWRPEQPNGGVFLLFFDVSEAYSRIDQADRLALSLDSARLQEAWLRQEALQRQRLAAERRRQKELIGQQAARSEAVLEGARRRLLLTVAASMIVLIAASLLLFWFLGTRRITCLRSWMTELTERCRQRCSSPEETAGKPVAGVADPCLLLDRQASACNRLPGRTLDEIGDLERSINAMLDTLDQTMVSRALLVQEIEERKRAEQRLRDSQQRLQTIFASVPAGVVIVDLQEERIIDANPTAVRLCAPDSGRRAEVVGRQWRELFALSGGGSGEGRLHVSAGHSLPILWTSKEVRLGGRRRLVLCFVDITVQEQARQRQEEAVRAAEQASRIKSQFLANMSHEIRTPLNGILGMSELALERIGDPETASLLRTVYNEASSLLRIINDVLDFSKIEAGRLELECVPFDLQAVCEEVVRGLVFAAEQKGLEMVYACDPEIPGQLLGDPGRIRQVLVNLAGNAVKFTDQGQVGIEVQVEEESERQVVVRFAVRDTGIGIPAEKQELIFQSFTQADGSMTRTYGGTGLGTAISKQLVEMMGGRIGLESEPGKGSCFWFTLPIRKAASASSGAEMERQLFAGMRGLVADDNPASLVVIQRYLAGWGCEVVTAADGQEALGLLARARDAGQPFDFLLADFRMPGLTGLDLAREVRREGDLRLPIVIMSAGASKAQEQDWQSAAVQEHLAKPVFRRDLRRVLARLCGRMAEQEDGAGVADECVSSHHAGPVRGRILLVEDYPTNREVACRFLRQAGYEVDVAANGQEALGCFQRQEYQLVLMDIQMPVMDGYAATAAIREMERRDARDRVPVLAMTAHAIKGYEEKCLAAGMDDYVTKPVQRDKLLATVARWLSCRGSGEGQAEEPAVLHCAELVGEMDGDCGFVGNLLRSFLASVRERYRLLQQAAQGGDVEQLRREAHAIKGAALNVTARALAEAAMLVEDGGELAGMLHHLPRIGLELARLEKAVQECCQQQ